MPSEAARRGGALALAGAVLLAGAFLATRREPAPPAASDARIAYYFTRLGGPGTFPAYARLGAAYLTKYRETARPEFLLEAERQLLTSLGYQRNYEALRVLAAVYLAQHRFREALKLAREAAATLPSDAEALGVLFDAALAAGEDAEAEAAAEKMAAAGPTFATLSRRAALLESRNELRGALEAMRDACGDAERHAAAEPRAWCQVRLGMLHLALCAPAEAEAAYRRALERLPGYPLALEHLAELDAARGDAARAVETYRQMLARTPAPRWRLALADLLDRAGQTDEAARERDVALAALKDSVVRGARDGVRELAFLLLEDPRTRAEGLHLAEREWGQRRDAFAADLLAWAYHTNGHDAEAVDTLRQAFATRSREPRVLLHAAAIFARTGDRTSARELLERLLACPAALQPADREEAERLRAALRL
jgi:tetratricopeptide (TPR) repeat protein